MVIALLVLYVVQIWQLFSIFLISADDIHASYHIELGDVSDYSSTCNNIIVLLFIK